MQFSVCLSTIVIISVSNCWDILWWPHSSFLTAKVCPIRRARLATTITAAISILMSLLLADKDTSSYRSRQLWLLENSASSWNRRSRSRRSVQRWRFVRNKTINFYLLNFACSVGDEPQGLFLLGCCGGWCMGPLPPHHKNDYFQTSLQYLHKS